MRFVSAAPAALLLLAALPARAADPAALGRVNAEIEERQAEIKKSYGDRKLSKDERKELNAKLSRARTEVLEEQGLEEKEYEASSAKLDRNEFKQMESAKKQRAAELAEKKKAPAPDQPKKAEEIIVEKNVPQRDLDIDLGGGKEIEIPPDGKSADQAPR